MDSIQAVDLCMELIVAKFVAHIANDEQCERKAARESYKVDERVSFVLYNIATRSLKEVFKHGARFIIRLRIRRVRVARV
jgi:hypothetical protein